MFLDNDYPATPAQGTTWTGGGGRVQQTAWGPLDWIKRRLGGQGEQGPSPDALPAPGTIHDQRRKREQAIKELMG
jgi:hypothetical protein